MDDKRASTLEALESFIQTQRSLLEQTQQDVAQLRKLKSHFLSKPNVDPQDLPHQLDEIGEVKDPEHYRLVIPKEIDWSAFSGCDPAPLHALTLAIQEKLSLGSKPASTQQSPLSDLQILVRDSKKTIIDPVLEKCAAYVAHLSVDDCDDVDVDDDDDDGVMGKTHHATVETEREQERKKIREIKKRKLHARLSLPGMSMGAAGVFVRKDVRDESAIVDVTAGETEGGSPTRPAFLLHEVGKDAPFGLDDSDGYGRLFPLPPIETDVNRVKNRPARTRRATARRQLWQEEEESQKSKKRKRLAGSTPTSASTFGAAAARPPAFEPTSAQDPESPMNIEGVSEDEEVEVAHATTNGSKSARGRARMSNLQLTTKANANAKSKSETYKQVWTESEQNLLEQLLEKIPDGEKNRWQKISQAMNGRRTPRQVASRVQKYFEKLKKYGINVK